MLEVSAGCASPSSRGLWGVAKLCLLSTGVAGNRNHCNGLERRHFESSPKAVPAGGGNPSSRGLLGWRTIWNASSCGLHTSPMNSWPYTPTKCLSSPSSARALRAGTSPVLVKRYLGCGSDSSNASTFRSVPRTRQKCAHQCSS
jgi:hypothetical protein